MRCLSLLEAKVLENKIVVQHALMNTIINNTSMIMYLMKPDGTILISNKSHAELFGLEPEQLVGRCWHELYKNPEAFSAEDKEVIETKQILKTERYIQLLNAEKGHWYRICKVPVFDEFQKVISVVVICENCDAEKELEKRKDTFIATMTHDLKTPTLAQINALQLLLKNHFGGLNKPQIDILQQLKCSCTYMSDLIVTILDTYMYDSGSVKIQHECFNINELLQETIGEVSNLLMQKRQTINISSSLSNKIISADKLQLKRVILNLLSNAHIHGLSDSVIDVKLNNTEDSRISLNIINQSDNISEETLKDVFSKFKQGENAKFTRTGTGLGLYLSKQIIEAHDGEIHALNDKETGTSTFGFSIPLTFQKKKQISC